MVSILGNYNYTFPKPIPLKLKLKDMLEDEVDEKYFLSDKMVEYITSKDDKYKVNENKLVINRDVACCKTTREGNTRADTTDYICNELPENTNILKIKNNTKKGYLEAHVGEGVDIGGRMQYHRGTVQKGKIQSLNTNQDYGVVVKPNDLRIRKLTPKECGRLMNVKDEDIDKILKNQSDSSAYHLFGDSICTNCLMAIFGQLLDIEWEKYLWKVQ